MNSDVRFTGPDCRLFQGSKPINRIFDEFERTDAAPAYDTESSYRFLNRAARPQWELVRDLIEDWYSEYPDDAKPDVRSRLQDDDYGQHMSAWWELYTYTLFRRLGYEVSIHPVVTNTSRRPDFLVCRDDVSFYVECVAYFSALGAIKGGTGGERSWIFEATNRARDPNFMVDIEFTKPALSDRTRQKSSDLSKVGWLH